MTTNFTNPIPDKHVLFCNRCFSLREQLIGLPSDVRRFEMNAPDHAHFVKRMCLGKPDYAGIVLVRANEKK